MCKRNEASPGQSPGTRIQSLDALRGFCILLVIAYHFGYDLVARELIPEGALYNPVLDILQPFFAGVFVALAGVSSRFSRSNLRRGLILLGCALLVTAVSLAVLPAPFLSLRAAFGYQPTGAEIGTLIGSGRLILHEDVLAQAEKLGITEPGALGAFALSCYKSPLQLLGTLVLSGILHLLAACVLLYALLDRLRLTAPAVVLSAFFLLFSGVTEWPEIPSADYFPLIPWVFVFFFGVWLGGPIREERFPKRFYEMKVPFFPAVGRRTLLIYLLHQPVLYGILWVVETAAG
ncbi:MAG: DUF1624 domain-containing protein [Oscillospiraceae bacterium]|jgi:uncharacterized membrane protein|nr:DUF1624 domain-containing protein [Oscillospiraceae bacterium]